MSVETEFVALLLATQAVTDLVGNRVALSSVPEGQLPLIVFTSDHDPTYSLNNALLADEVTLNVQCWAEDGLGALAVADAVRVAIASAAASAGVTVTSQSTVLDEETGLDGVTLTVSYWA